MGMLKIYLENDNIPQCKLRCHPHGFLCAQDAAAANKEFLVYLIDASSDMLLPFEDEVRSLVVN